MSGKRRSFQKYKKPSEPVQFDVLNANETPSLVSWSASIVSNYYVLLILGD
jgi:hypothetical protein